MGSTPIVFFFLSFFVLPRIASVASRARDAEALLALKAAVDPSGAIPWRRGAEASVCSDWLGVKECSADGRITKLVLEYLNLTGAIPADGLAPLGELRVLSFKSNALSGPIPDLFSLPNLKSLYLNSNRFSGAIPAGIAGLHRLKVVVLSGNLLAGPIPHSLTSLPRLYTLYLDDNNLTGNIPAFDQPTLRFFNVSGNGLSGEIPATRSLSQFNLSSFANNPSLCGAIIQNPCFKNQTFPPSMSPEPSDSSPIISSAPLPQSKKKHKKRLIAIIAGSVGGFLFLSIIVILLLSTMLRRNRTRSAGAASATTKAGERVPHDEVGPSGEPAKRGFAWDGEGLGKLVFCGGNEGGGEMYGLEDLLRASAETLGRGTTGSTYKAVMESGFIVTVKRLKDSAFPGLDDFRRRTEELGRLRHPNLVPLRAYFQAKEERLLVYDYFPNGSLFSLVHGSRPSGSGKPLHWTSCLKIAEDVATGLFYLHQSSPTIVHGNLKSSNILLGPDFESCLTDYGLVPTLRPPDSLDEPSSLFYRAPESHHPHRAFTQQSDIYSFGVLLLELLTGKTPFQDLVEQHGPDIRRWVRSVREEEIESGDEPTSGNEASEEKLVALLNIAMACVSITPEGRPATKEVLRMIKEARAEALVSSNSSDHSPGRWSDTVQSLPREYGSEHSNFAERD